MSKYLHDWIFSFKTVYLYKINQYTLMDLDKIIYGVIYDHHYLEDGTIYFDGFYWCSLYTIRRRRPHDLYDIEYNGVSKTLEEAKSKVENILADQGLKIISPQLRNLL